METLTAEQVDSIDEMLYNFFEKNEYLEMVNIQKVLNNIKASIKRGDSIVLKDGDSFIWAKFVKSPNLFTEIYEVILMAGWGDIEPLYQSIYKKAKIRGVTDIFVNKHYPFSEISKDDFVKFETAYRKKL